MHNTTKGHWDVGIEGMEGLWDPGHPLVRQTVEALCKWNADGRPFGADGILPPEADSLAASSRPGLEEGAKKLPLATLTEACQSPSSWLPDHAAWALRSAAVMIRALEGCTVVVSPSDAADDSVLFSGLAEAAGARASLTDVIAGRAPLGRSSRRRACDESATATLTWSGAIRDMVAGRCSALGVPVCRAGRLLLGGRGLEPRDAAALLASQPTSVIGTDLRLTSGLGPSDLPWCSLDDVTSLSAVPRLPIITAPVGVPSLGAQPRARSDRPRQRRVVGFAGRVEPEKSIGLALVGAAMAIQADDPPTTFRVIGWGSMQGPMARLAGRLGLFRPPHSLEFAGRLTGAELAAAVADLDVLVFPSLRSETETFGLVPLEAMAAGVPVVAFGAGGSSDFIVNGTTAVVPETLDAPGVAAAIRTAIRDAAVLRESGRRLTLGPASEPRRAAHWAVLLDCMGSCPEGGVGSLASWMLGQAGGLLRLRRHRECAVSCAEASTAAKISGPAVRVMR